jgi:O-antigen/teichoic acid export membrane protein
MNQAFLSNIILLMAVNVLIKPFYIFGIEIPMQNTIGNESYGTFFTFFGFTMLFQIINEAGFHQYSSRAVAQNRTAVGFMLRKITVLKIGLGSIFMMLISGVGWVMGYWELNLILLLLVGFNQILMGYIPYLRSNLSSLGWYYKESLVSALDKVIMIVVIGYMLLFHQDSFTIQHFVIGQTIAFAITILVILWMLRPALDVSIPTSSQHLTLKILIKESLPFALIIFLSMVYTRIDAVMIERLMDNGTFHTGVYGAAFRLMDAATMFAFLFAGLLLPMFSRLLSIGQDTSPLYNLAFKVVFVLSISLAVPVWFYRTDIMSLLYTDYTPEHSEILGFLFIAFVAKATTFVSGTYLLAVGKLKVFNYILAGTVGLNIILNYWWIQTIGTVGAAQATCLTQSFVAFGCVFLVIQHMKSHNHLRLYGTLFLYAIVCVVTINYWSNVDLNFYWYTEAALAVIFCYLGAIIGGLIRPKTLKELLKARFEKTNN